MMGMILGLGLIHGFGLSTRLQQLPLDPNDFLMNVISFNIGVEFGQILALAAMLAVISLWRNRDSFRPFSLVTNYSLIALGGFLFVMQMDDYYQNPQHESLAPVAVTNPSIIQKAEANAPTFQSSTTWRDTYRMTLPGGGEKEFKLLVEKGMNLEYAWSTDGGKLFFDMHGAPEGDTTGAFKSYRVGIASQADGTLDAPFTGTHGWYWKNESKIPVTITLNVRGDYQPMTK